MPNKVYPSPRAALEGVLFDGMTIMSGGFGLSGNPESLIPAIRDAGTKELTVISNNCGADGFGLLMLLANGQIRKMISSYIGENKLFWSSYTSQASSSLSSIRRGRSRNESVQGAPRHSRVLHANGRRDKSSPRESRSKNSMESFTVRETRLHLGGPCASSRAWRADPAGNLMFRKTARNFTPNMATAAKVTIAEVEEIVEAGAFDPDGVHTPGHLREPDCQIDNQRAPIEKLTTRPKEVA